MKDNEVLVDYIKTYSLLVRNMNTNRGTLMLQKKCNKLEKELFKRGIFSEDDIKELNS